MKQKVLLICKIYLFCIYFSFNNFNYPYKKLAIPSNWRNSSTTVLRNSRKTFAEEKQNLHGFWGQDIHRRDNVFCSRIESSSAFVNPWGNFKEKMDTKRWIITANNRKIPVIEIENMGYWFGDTGSRFRNYWLSTSKIPVIGNTSEKHLQRFWQIWEQNRRFL